MSQKPGTLTSDLLTKKPPITPTGAPMEPLDPDEPGEPEAPAPAPAAVIGRDRSLSCKVDADRYRRMGQACLDLGLTNQAILSQGLDLWLKKHKR